VEYLSLSGISYHTPLAEWAFAWLKKVVSILNSKFLQPPKEKEKRNQNNGISHSSFKKITGINNGL
jgi:hypothetical protein